MYPRDVRVNDPQEALIVEQALAMYRELRDVARHAPDGQVLERAESLAVTRGRELTRTSLAAILAEEAQAVEKRGRPAGRVRVATGGSTAEGGRETS